MHIHDHHDHDHKDHRVPFTRFFLVTGAELVAACAIFKFLFPGVFANEATKPWPILLWVVLLGLPMSLFEYLYHRYLLHSAVLPFMGSMHKAHATHHGLTSVKAPVTPKDPGKMVPVTNEYPVEEPHQEDSMMFPLYALPIFYGIFMLALGLPIKLLMPNQPLIIATIISVTLYYSSYEVWHAILHLPFEKFWKPVLEGRFTRRIFRRMYSFHLMHHWRPTANLAIVGFWGVALWDYAFRTYHRPGNMPLKGAEVNYLDAKMVKPLWPISQLDRWQAGLYRGSRAIERFFAKLFVKKAAR